ncbi:hypothetical protein NHG33_06625 [Aerococcaceae bacterium NML130460]|nr:hypothetical protein [Aerococcaceae bacterium NML130460]
MSKFIELTRTREDKVYFNVDNICSFFWNKDAQATYIFTPDCTEQSYIVEETPAEIMAKIQEVQNG